MDAPTYSFYAAAGFSGGSDGFDHSVMKAKALVDRIVGPNEVGDGAAEAYGMAVCAAAERLAELGDGPAVSARVGSFSVTQQGTSSGREEAAAAAMAFLVPAGLAWAGV